MSTTTEDNSNILYNVPSEVFTSIFSYLPPITLLVCRAVCLRWKLIIDEYSQNGMEWRKHCRRDYADICDSTFIKSTPGLSWYQLYRSLTLWPKLPYAIETRREFAIAKNSLEKIKHMQVFSGTIGVHRKDSIVYYDINTLEKSQQAITGKYQSYRENENVILLLNEENELSFITKVNASSSNNIIHTLQNVKLYFLYKNTVYYITKGSELYLCTITNRKVTRTMLKHIPFTARDISYKNNKVNILTSSRYVYELDGVELRKTDSHLQGDIEEDLRKFNLFDHPNWKIYCNWIYTLQYATSGESLTKTVSVYTHGPVMCIGNYFGILCIYYSLYTSSVHNLLQSNPIKKCRFAEEQDCANTMCPIFHIDIVEGKDSHTILVSLEKKIISIEITHSS